MKIFDRFESKVKDEVKTKVNTVNWNKVYWGAFGLIVVVCATRKPQNITVINNPQI